ncbi:MAG: F0F1 ATP synthase subunit B [Cytophagaceae bacterium]|jgi:F-type H+-transporting ATPase subunit b|nr:F0F1 ATP synthase subunit B [Cytophagaceae bacterium]
MSILSLITPAFGLFFWQTVLFLIVLFLLSKFAWAPIMSGIKEREQTIASALDAAEQAKKDMEQLKASNEALLQEAKVERERLLKEAHHQAAVLVEEAKSKATSEATRVLEDARKAIQTEKNAAIAEIKNQSASLALEIAERIIKKELANQDAQRQLVDEYMKEVNVN